MNADQDLNRLFGQSSTDPYVICWRELDEACMVEELERLKDWVGWATSRYNMDHKVVPPCWADHGSIVEELSALRTFWESCFQEDAAPADPMAFHRDLTLAMRRLRDWTSMLGCTRTVHRE